MKKFSIYLLGALAMAFTACEDAPETPPMQANPQEPLLEGSNVKVETASILSTTDQAIALENYRNEELVEVLTEGELTDLPEGATTSYIFELGKNETFDPAEQLEVTLKDGKGYISPESWSAAHVALFGKSPKAKEAYYRIAAYATIDGVDYRIGGTDYYAAAGTVKESCFDQGFVIYDAYYFISDLNGWNITPEGATPYKFNHSDADIYDDPVFTLTIEVPEGFNGGSGCYWKVASQKAIDENNWDNLGNFYGPATDGSEATEGQLVDENVQAGKIAEAGKYRVTINMESMEYTIEKLLAPEFLSTPGGSNSWNKAASNWLAMVKKTVNDVEVAYNMGAAVLDDKEGFKLYAGDTEDWDNALTYGAGDAEGTLAKPGNNIAVPKAGLYWVKVNTAEMTYTLTEVTTVGVVGGSYGWDAGQAMTRSDDFRTWTADVTFTDNTEWKFKFNADPSWEMNYGDNGNGGLTIDGGNIKTAEAGDYTITISFAGNYPTYTITKK